MQSFEIRSNAELSSATRKIIAKYPTKKIVFRGQILDRPLIPTIFRGDAGSSADFPGCIPSLTANWRVLAEKIVQEFRALPSSWIEVQAVMQHYGYRSTLIDVTSNLNVALWFALHKFESEQVPLYINNQLRSAVFQCSRYVPSKTGYIYLLRLPDQPDQQYVNLTDIMPLAARRIHNQRAGAIVCSRERVSADNLVIAKIALNGDGWFKGSKADLDMKELFPPPSSDVFYRKLCTIPYYILPIREMEKIRLGHPLLGMFPIYAQSTKELLKEYVPLTTIIQTRPSLKWNVASGVVECDNSLFKVRSAQRVSISRLMVESIIGESKNNNNLDGLPSRNIVFEFEPEGSLFPPSSKALKRVVLGVWVVFGGETLSLVEIVDNFTDVFLDNYSAYSLKKMGWIKNSCKDGNYYLKMLQALSASLADKTLQLNKLDELYWEVSYRKNE